METTLGQSSEAPPVRYDRPATYKSMIRARDVMVPMRDGVLLSVDIYRPDTEERLPALLAFAIYNKDLMGPETAEALPPQPAWAPLWTGCLETGDTHFLVGRGYVHVIGSPRAVGKSAGGGARTWDSYDLIEWIAAQAWCDGSVGMVGISGYGAEQLHAAKQQPPSLKAIFPFDPRGAYGTLGGFRDEYPGGVLHLFRYLIGNFAVLHGTRGTPGALSAAREEQWRVACANPDYRVLPFIWNVLSMKGQHMPGYFELLINPYDDTAVVEQAEADFGKVTIPVYTGSGWYGAGYKTHLNGAQTWFARLRGPKKLLLAGTAHLERPWHGLHAEVLRWFDHWLKGIDTGIMADPPVRYWVEGERAWRSGTDWPLPETRWTHLFLTGWERLRSEPFVPDSADDFLPPDAFVQMPLSQTRTVQRLRYLSEPLSSDVLMAGPSVLTLFAAIDQDDTNWIVVLKDVGPDHGAMSAREGERELPALPERELTRGWLKASHRAIDEERSRPWKPWHYLTREKQAPVPVGEIVEYRIELMAVANLFRAGHRICLEICALDVPTGVGGATNAEYVPFHICSSRTVLHRVYHDTAHPSALLLPIVG